MGHVEATVRRYYALVDANDVEGVVAIFATDALYRRPGYPDMRGEAALRAFYGGERVIASGRHTLTTVLVDGDRAAVTGDFEGVLKSGERRRLRFADFFTLAGSRFSARETFFFAPMV